MTLIQVVDMFENSVCYTYIKYSLDVRVYTNGVG